MVKSDEQLYSEMVAALIKPGEQMVEEITPHTAHLNHMALLLAGETGELVDAIKKHTIYGKDLDFVNVIEEMGDIEFALEALRAALGINRDEVLSHNIEKLAMRYAKGRYSDQAAKDRADKQIGMELASDIEESCVMNVDDGIVDHH